MGIDTDAHLIYGIRLGGQENGWTFNEVDEDNVPLLSGGLDFHECAEALLLDTPGVEVVETQHINYPDYFLAVTELHIEATRGNPKRVQNLQVTAEHERKLNEAIAVLGITFSEPAEAGWYVASWSDYS